MATLDTVTGVKIKSYSVSGPASYATGGFLHDASADFSWIGFIDVIVTTRGALPPCDYEFLHNRNLSSAEALGQSTIKIVRGRYDRGTVGNVSGQPGGVTVQAAKTAAGTTTGSDHTHSFDHDHPLVTSATENLPGGVGVLFALGGGNMRNHTHVFDVPAFVGNSTSRQ